ncbi:YveK family protein [Clostridium polynesiense]|uniref:YveK family protein n=1 Tax=Clostridium polynesiense TaxID=1325933 RepID=UPI00058ECDB6|nr:Wzz/FepE/Etk N-terminal domain-containing protein [Clostridium polynesiense]
MELREYFKIVKKRWLLIVLVTLASTLISAIVSYFVIKPTYKADISVIIGSSPSKDEANKQNYNDVLMYQKMVKSYSEIVKTRIVAEDVIQSLNLNITANELINMVSVAPKGDTEFITITVKSKDQAKAREIANQYAKSLKKVSAEIRKVDNVQLLDEAVLPTAPDSPKPLLNMAIAFFLGLMISIGIIFLIEYLDNTVKTQEDMEKMFEIPVIGSIPLVEREK